MDTISTAPAPIDIHPVNHDLVTAAGAPGTRARVAVFHALNILAKAPAYQPRKRGPDAYDMLGFVRAVVSETLADCDAQLVPLDDVVALNNDDWIKGMGLELAEHLLTSWGLRRIPFDQSGAGDLILFSMPQAHIGVRLATREAALAHIPYARPEEHQGAMASCMWGRPPGQQWLSDWWSSRIVCAFTWGGQ